MSVMIKQSLIDIAYLYALCRAKHVRQLVSNISDNLVTTKKWSLLSHILLIIWCIVVIINIMAVYFTITYHEHYFVDYYWSLSCYGMLTGWALLYVYVIYGVHLIECNAIHVVMDSNEWHKSYERVIQSIIKVKELKDSVNQCLGVFPLIIFTELFITTCLRLTHLTIRRYIVGKWGNIHGMLEYTEICLLDIMFVICVEYLQSKRPTVSQMYSKLNALNVSEKVRQQFIYCYTKSAYKSSLNLFQINCKFLLTFIGSCTTFTVMLIQLLENDY